VWRPVIPSSTCTATALPYVITPVREQRAAIGYYLVYEPARRDARIAAVHRPGLALVLMSVGLIDRDGAAIIVGAVSARSA
jgi:hypothetical protein